MRKLFVLLSIISLLFAFSVPALANGCESNRCYGTGDLGAKMAAGDYSLSYDAGGALAIGGGLTSTITYREHLDVPGNSVKRGRPSGMIVGATSQGTLNGSYIVLTDNFNSDGFTGGVAGMHVSSQVNYDNPGNGFNPGHDQ